MQKYPDKVIILKVNGDGPYGNPVREQVYTGRCRAFLDGKARYRLERVMNSTYRVVIPDRKMPDIGENFVVAVRFHNNPSVLYWDVVGYVKDFARYERICEITFELVKENIIYEDIPGPSVEQSVNRTLAISEDEWLHIESTGLIAEGVVADEPVHIIRPEKPWIDPDKPEEQWNVELQLRWLNPETGEFVVLPAGGCYIVQQGEVINYNSNDNKEHHTVFIPRYPENGQVVEGDDHTIHVCLLRPQEGLAEPVVFYDKPLVVFEHKY